MYFILGNIGNAFDPGIAQELKSKVVGSPTL